MAAEQRNQNVFQSNVTKLVGSLSAFPAPKVAPDILSGIKHLGTVVGSSCAWCDASLSGIQGTFGLKLRGKL